MYYTGLTGLLKLTKAQYDAIDHDANTKYIVKDGNTVAEYLGDLLIGGNNLGGVIIGTPVVQMVGTVSPISSTIYGTAEEVE